MENKIMVEREPFQSKKEGQEGKMYFSYFVRGVIRGKGVKVLLVAPDKGGYAVLDIVFGDVMQAELVLTPYEIKDEATGRVTKGNTYSARTVDEDTGEVYECKVKTYRDSDKNLMKMLLSQRDAGPGTQGN